MIVDAQYIYGFIVYQTSIAITKVKSNPQMQFMMNALRTKQHYIHGYQTKILKKQTPINTTPTHKQNEIEPSTRMIIENKTNSDKKNLSNLCRGPCLPTWIYMYQKSTQFILSALWDSIGHKILNS